MRRPIPDSALPSDPFLAERIMKIRNLGRRVLADSLTLGRLMWECKERVKHGQWEAFCETHLAVKVQTVNRFVRAFVFSETEAGKQLVGFGASWFVLTMLCCAPNDDVEAILDHARDFASVPKAPIVQNILRARKTRDRAEGVNNHPSREAIKEALSDSVAKDALGPIKRWLRDNRPRTNFCEIGAAAIELIGEEVARRRNVVEVPPLPRTTEAVQLSLAMAGPPTAA